MLPALSVTALVVAFAELHTPTCTINRFPAVTTCDGVNVNELPTLRADVCCTNTGFVGALGVTAFDAADAGPVPTAFVAATVNV